MPRSNNRNTHYVPRRESLALLSPDSLAQRALEKLVAGRWTGSDDSNTRTFREIFLVPDDATAFIAALNDHLDRAGRSGFIGSNQISSFDTSRQADTFLVTLSMDAEDIPALQDAADRLGVRSRGATIS